MTYDAMEQYLAKRLTVATSKNSRQIAADFPARVRAQCFFSARVAESRILDRIRQISDAYTRGELNLAEARTRLKEYLITEEGYKPGGGISNLASTARVNLIFKQNAAMAAAVGEYQVGRDPDVEGRWPSWRYLESTSLVKRDDHARYAGKVYLKSDPIWHSIFPPNGFGCNCGVEDSDATPDKPVRLVKDPSGFEFDPADAFREFDLRNVPSTFLADVEESAEIEFGDQVLFIDGKAKISDSSYYGFLQEGLVSAKQWDLELLPSLPDKLSPEEARNRLKIGFSMKDAAGNSVSFNAAILEHWKNKRKAEQDGRLSRLNMGVETVKKPAEMWDQKTQTAYIQAFRNRDGKPKGCLVFVKKTGEAITYFPKDLKELDKARKGLSVKVLPSSDAKRAAQKGE